MIYQTYVALSVAPNKRHNDDAFVTALVLVHSIHFQSFKDGSLQQTGDGFQLLPVRCNDPNVSCPASSLHQKHNTRLHFLYICKCLSTLQIRYVRRANICNKQHILTFRSRVTRA